MKVKDVLQNKSSLSQSARIEWRFLEEAGIEMRAHKLLNKAVGRVVEKVLCSLLGCNLRFATLLYKGESIPCDE